MPFNVTLTNPLDGEIPYPPASGATYADNATILMAGAGPVIPVGPVGPVAPTNSPPDSARGFFIILQYAWFATANPFAVGL